MIIYVNQALLIFKKNTWCLHLSFLKLYFYPTIIVNIAILVPKIIFYSNLGLGVGWFECFLFLFSKKEKNKNENIFI